MNVAERETPAAIMKPADERRALGEELEGGPSRLIGGDRRERAPLVQARKELGRRPGQSGVIAEDSGLERPQQLDREGRPEHARR